jgi:hypothetical protein
VCWETRRRGTSSIGLGRILTVGLRALGNNRTRLREAGLAVVVLVDEGEGEGGNRR